MIEIITVAFHFSALSASSSLEWTWTGSRPLLKERTQSHSAGSEPRGQLMWYSLWDNQEKTCTEQRKPLYKAPIYTKAFEFVTSNGLFKILAKIGCPPTLLSLIRSFHDSYEVYHRIRRLNIRAVQHHQWSQTRLCSCPDLVRNPLFHSPRSSIHPEQPQRVFISIPGLMETSSISTNSEPRRCRSDSGISFSPMTQ